jgi:hypothetical protein
MDRAARLLLDEKSCSHGTPGPGRAAVQADAVS